jgi:hypothetical protein
VSAFVTASAQFSESEKMVMKENNDKRKKIVGKTNIGTNSVVPYVVSVLLRNSKLAPT